MESVIKKWGKRPALRLSAAVLHEANLRINQKVSVNVQCGKVVIEALSEPVYTLEGLVSGITESNQHAGPRFGRTVGQEVW